MKKLLALILTTGSLFAPMLSYAGQLDLLLDKLVDKQVISAADATQMKIEAQEEERAAIAAGKSENMPSWIQNLSMTGDVRLRVQNDWNAATNFDRLRERLRLRWGVQTRIVDGMNASFGLATGGEKLQDGTISSVAVANNKTAASTLGNTTVVDNSDNSANYTFDGFTKPTIMVDYAYLEYSPCSVFKVDAGKIKLPIWETTDLLWDNDINPDGLGVGYSKNVSDTVGVFVNGAWLTFGEKNGSYNSPDADLGQVGASWKASDIVVVKAAVAYQQLNVAGKNTYNWGTPAFDYKGMTPSVNVTLYDILGPMSFAVYGDSFQNGDSKPTTDTSASCFGVMVGNCHSIGEFGQWTLNVTQRTNQANAWLNSLGDDDSYGGALNSSGTVYKFLLGLTHSASVGVNYFSFDKINGATAITPKSLVQADMNYKF